MEEAEERPVYLDFNATTPLCPEVIEVMIPCMRDVWGNPSSAHAYGTQAKKAVEGARRHLAQLLGCETDELTFTSGGSEANNHAIKGIAYALRSQGNHIITSQIEHPAVIEPCKFLESHGFRVTYLPVDATGRVNPADVEAALTPQTLLVTIMHANNEVGTIQPIREIAEITRKREVLLHTDAAQSVGKIPVNVNELGVDLLTVVGHKFYAPKGIGALFVRRGVTLEKMVHGANHELDKRAGTENVLEIVGLGKAAEVARLQLDRNMKHMKEMRDRLHAGLIKHMGEARVRLNGHPEFRLPNTLNVSFHRIEANTLLTEIQDRVAASAGAACHADEVDVSPVIEAMKVPIEYAMGTIRFSTGRFTTTTEIDTALDVITSAAQRLVPPDDEATAVSGLVDVSPENVKLTRFTHGMGCACKLRPQALEKILTDIPITHNPNVIVGIETEDDAAVFRVNEDLALVGTCDFFTPICDDPFMFGAISAANSLSDIYAMGATPLFALNIVGFPSNRLPMEVLKKILQGGTAKAKEAGIPILGGHTVEDTEPKYGMAVYGRVHPHKVWRNCNLQVGDALVLTKAIGVGILSTAAKRGLASRETIDKMLDLMATLNRRPAESCDGLDVHAVTDVTGFGLLGHLKEMTVSSKVDCTLYAKDIPMIPEAIEFANQGVVPGGTVSNFEYVGEMGSFHPSISKPMRFVIADAQTSGGLLIGLPANQAPHLVERMVQLGVKTPRIIGDIHSAGVGRIHVVPSRPEGVCQRIENNTIYISSRIARICPSIRDPGGQRHCPRVRDPLSTSY
eukprot:TRINITY_DN13206_c0_g1_i2.p1 TRINITY_DN13206_c0_g1~~TRINITY_DN13206_c0_g1_i2.p1  ORF type:complete len:796 (+),score=188.19 TRINITY_DN13206_c0_g1_i2:32-2419(+)